MTFNLRLTTNANVYATSFQRHIRYSPHPYNQPLVCRVEGAVQQRDMTEENNELKLLGKAGRMLEMAQ